MALFDTVRAWFGRFGALAERTGTQVPLPSSALVPDTQAIGPDGALQISTVWGCIERRANVVASLPLFVYERVPGQAHKGVARNTRLFSLLHDSPNSRMTPFEFWRAMLMNHDLRGNAYARIDRDERTGEAVALWPMPADQVDPVVLADGSMVYAYQIDGSVAVYAEQNVLHLKGLGNGTMGLAKLEFMRATTHEAASAQTSASRLFGNGGKPTGVLMIDSVLNKEQRERVRQNFADLAVGNLSRLHVLEANMKYQQLSLSPEDQQLLETRRFGVEEICRWFDVPPVLVHHSNVTTWGSGVEQIVAGFHKFTVRPLVVSIEQAVTKRVLTPRQRASLSAEFSIDALLRGSPTERSQFYATGLQNGYITRNEVRQLENLPPDASPQADQLTAQVNLIPLAQLGVAAAEPPAPPERLSSLVRQYLAN
jgi:HK97 family phage portal protein